MKYQHARRMRKSRVAVNNRDRLNERSTPSELRFAKALQEAAGIRHRQNFIVRTAEAPGGYYVVDFYLPAHKIFIEIDGGVHRSDTRRWNDILRQESIERKHPDIAFVRFWNSEVDADPAAAVQRAINATARNT